MNRADKYAGIAFKVMVVIYVLVIAFQKSFRPDVYSMVRVPVEGLVGILMIYICARWALTELGFFDGRALNLNRKSLLKTLGAIAAMILFGVAIELISHNLSVTRQATEYLQASSEGRDALGDPIRTGWFIKGRMGSDGDGGKASFSIPVKGSKAAGELEVRGIKKDGSWQIVDLYLTLDRNGAVVQIPH